MMFLPFSIPHLFSLKRSALGKLEYTQIETLLFMQVVHRRQYDEFLRTQFLKQQTLIGINLEVCMIKVLYVL
jgi:hypothetical protein